MKRKVFLLTLIVSATAFPIGANAQLVTGLQGASGSTVGPDGALYVTEGAVGRISRIDPASGAVTPFASGLPPSLIGVGGVVDVVFLDGVAYALVTMVDAFLGGTGIDGIYRVDGPSNFTVIADIGTFSLNNPPATSFMLPTGVQYAMETYRGGFVVTDGHLNRVLRVTLDGEVSEFVAFDNVVPTGLEVWGNTVLVAQAGAVPHLPEDGKVVAFEPRTLDPVEIASGGPLLVDVEFGLGRTLYGLAQGIWNGEFEGSPAFANTGELLEVNWDGSFSVRADGLDRPTSLEIIGNDAYVVTLGGEVWVVEGVSSPPFGLGRRARP